MTKTAQLQLKALNAKELEVLAIVKAYEQSKMMKLTLEEFVRSHAEQM